MAKDIYYSDVTEMNARTHTQAVKSVNSDDGQGQSRSSESAFIQTSFFLFLAGRHVAEREKR